MDKRLEWPGEADGPKGILRWPNAAVSTPYSIPLSYHSIRGCSMPWGSATSVSAVETLSPS